MPGGRSVGVRLRFSGTSKYYLWFGSYTERHRLANSPEASEDRPTLAMPIGEAASDIAGAMLKLKLPGDKSWSCCKSKAFVSLTIGKGISVGDESRWLNSKAHSPIQNRTG